MTMEGTNILNANTYSEANMNNELMTDLSEVDDVLVEGKAPRTRTPYTCQCNRQYLSRYHMEIHQKFLCSSLKKSKLNKDTETQKTEKDDITKLNSSDDETYVKMIKENSAIYICGCNKRYTTKSMLKKHQESGEVEEDWMLYESTDEEGNSVYKCKCSETFDDETKLKTHISKGKCKGYIKIEEKYEVKRDCFGRSVYMCSLCNQTFCKKKYLSLHRSKTKCKLSNKASSGYKCIECNVSYAKKKLLVVHEKRFHIREFKCEHCYKNFTNITSLRNHKTLVHKDGSPKFSCEYCGMTFLGVSPLMKHIRTHTNEKPFQCHLCRKKFVEERTLKVHVNFVHVKDEKNFICDVCGATFARKEYLLTHANVHKKDRRYKCDHCDSSFRWNAAKRKHMFVKHLDKLNLFKCRYCEKKFKKEKNCEFHELDHEKSFIKA